LFDKDYSYTFLDIHVSKDFVVVDVAQSAICNLQSAIFNLQSAIYLHIPKNSRTFAV